MEGEVKAETERRSKLQKGPEIHLVHGGLPQEDSIFQNMQHYQQPDSERRMYDMSGKQLVSQANNTVGTSSSVRAAPASSSLSSQYSMDSWNNSWKMKSSPWIFNPGSSLGINTAGTAGESTMQKPHYDDVLAPGKIIFDLNLTPDEMVSTSFQPTEPEFPPITLETPRKRLPEADQEPNAEPVKELDILETGFTAGVKKDKRARDDEISQLKTPSLKRKKIRPKVVRESNKPSSSSTDSKARIRKSRLDFDHQDEAEEYCGHTCVSTGGEDVMKSEEDLPSNFSHIFQCFRRKRSRILTRPRKKLLESIVPTKGCKLRGRLPDLEAIVSKLQSTVSRKKRSHRDRIASRMNARVLSLHWRRQHLTGTDIWERSLRMDALIKLFQELDINREGPFLPHNIETALLLRQKECQEEQAIVKYSKKQQPKVQLDPETSRVWKLLMLSSDSDGVDGSDEEKRRWWKEERNLFHGRVNSFIARMRLVQGDRTFSPWKGSVVDSVVGVFLTQNVSDHTSSSAYMDLAAEFPVDWNVNKGSCLEVCGSSVTHETVMNLDPRNGVSTPRILNRVIIKEVDDDDEDVTGTFCRQESSKTSDSYISSEQVGSQMESGLNGLSQVISVVSSTSTHQCELNLNEVPPQVENYDAFQKQAYEDSQGQHMLCRHQQEVEISTLQAQDQQLNTSTKDVKKKTINRKKATTSRPPKSNNPKESAKKKSKKPAEKSKPEESFDWDSLRKQAESGGEKKVRPESSMDTVDWDALRCTNVHKIADIIRKRGMNNMLAERIKAFLNRLVRDHGSIDLEWLRNIQPDKAKEYLLSINGLGLKSVECVRLLSLHQVAFPVDTNVGRIAVRLGWVPLQPLPDELRMHLLELYPVLDSVQKYLWPRLCKLDQKTLYELHYHMITFGKVFCTKVKPNCTACPMKAECRHYASAHASSRLALPEPEESQSTTVMVHKRKPLVVNFPQNLFLFQEIEHEAQQSQNCQPIIEEPASPEQEHTVHDIEDFPWDNNSGTSSRDPWENKDVIPTIMLSKKAADISQALVVLSAQETSIPRPKLKTKEKLRTEHLVYELPDYHSILKGFETREAEDKVPYLLAIWTPGETINSIQPPKQRCDFQGKNTLCHGKKCFQCNKIREEKSQIVRGTILIPCRTAMRGVFPLNGTTSINPVDVPRQLIWNLRTSTTYFGSSVSAICKGLSVDAIRDSFKEGYVCVRGFERENRNSENLVKRLHYSNSKRKQEDEE